LSYLDALQRLEELGKQTPPKKKQKKKDEEKYSLPLVPPPEKRDYKKPKAKSADSLSNLDPEFAEKHPTLTKVLTTASAPLRAVFENPWVKRAGQTGSEIMFLTDRDDKVSTGSKAGDVTADIAGSILGFGAGPASVGTQLFSGGVKATEKLIPRLPQPTSKVAQTLVKEGAPIAGGSVAFEAGMAGANERPISPTELGMAAGANVALDLATRGLVRGLPKMRTDTPAIKNLDLRPEPKPLPPPKEVPALPPTQTRLIPEITPEITPEGVIHRPGRTGQPTALPMAEAEAVARADVQRKTLPLLPGKVDNSIWQKATSERKLLGHGEIPIEERSYETVGDREVKAFQYEHPEVKPHVQEEAFRLLEELNNTIKGQRNKYGTTKRYTSNSIATIKDSTGASYKEIRNALLRIINDQGMENQALAKRIELVIDDNLTNGTRTIEGYEMPPNQDYIKLKNNIYGRMASKETATTGDIDALMPDFKLRNQQQSLERATQNELDNAKHILRTTKNLDRAAKILETYPELQPEFKGWMKRINHAQKVRRETPKSAPKPEVKPNLVELQAARNILKTTQNPARIAKILEVYPELQKEFPKLTKKAQTGKVIGTKQVQAENVPTLTPEPQVVQEQATATPQKAGTYDAGTIGAAKLTIPEKQSTIPGTDQKVRSFHVSAIKSPMTKDEVKSGLLTDIYEGGPGVYEQAKLKKLDEQAKKFINEDIEKATQFVLQEGKPSPLHTATGIRLIEKYQNQGNYDRAIDVATALSQRLTKQGQAISAARIVSNLSPEGVLVFAQRQINKINKSRKLNIPGLNKEVKLTPEDAENLKKLAERVRDAKDDAAKIEASQELQAALNTLRPAGIGRKIATTQTIAQLLNPKTQVRNILGNEIFYRLERLNKLVATPIDWTRSKLTGAPRTVTFATAGQKGYWEGFLKGVKAGWKGVSPKGLQTQYDLGQTLAFDPKGNPAEKTMSFLERSLWATMKGFDYAAYNRAYKQTIGELATLRAINQAGKADKELVKKFMQEVDDNINNIADQYGKYVTYQDENLISRSLQTVKQRVLNLNKDFGLGDIVLKYPKTPGALIARGLEYSPAGFLRAAYQIAKAKGMIKGNPDPREATLALSRAITGTLGLTGLGYFFADKGIITGEASKDKDVRALEKQIGAGPFKVNLTALSRWVRSGFNPKAAEPRESDRIINYDWALPVAMSISMGANANQTISELDTSETANKLTKATEAAAMGGAKTVIEQPVLQGLKQLTQGYESEDIITNIINTGKMVPSSFTPTLLNQIRQYSDNTKRISYDPNYFKEAINRAKYKIPGANKYLPKAYTTFGEPAETFQDNSNTFFNVFLNPAFVSKYKLTPEAKMVIDIFKETGETKHVPRVVNKYFKVGGKRIDLTPEEYSKLQRIVGEVTKEGFSRIPKGAPNEAKIKAMRRILDKAGKIGKREILKERGIKTR